MIKRHQKSEPRKANGNQAVLPSGNGKRAEQNVPPIKKTEGQSKGKSNVNEWFRRFAQKTSEKTGSPWAFLIALAVIILWGILGPLFGFSDTWQLVINTATTIVTFLMVFLIQNTQNRDAKAIHLKLDELIHAIKGARNKLIDLEECSEEEIGKLEKQFKRIRQMHQEHPQKEDEARGK